MGLLYLFRHGQPNADGSALSELGREQSRLLGAAMAYVRFDSAYSGTLTRQMQSAEEFGKSYGGGLPAVTAEAAWDEIDMEGLYRQLAAPLARDDAQFGASRRRLAADPSDRESLVECHAAIARAWMERRYPCAGASWVGYRDRVLARLAEVAETAAVFTSMTPIAICAMCALGTSEGALFGLAKDLCHTGMTTIRFEDSHPRLTGFNDISHLPASMRSVFNEGAWSENRPNSVITASGHR